MRPAARQRAPQRRPLTEQVLLAHDLVEGLGPHARGERRRGGQGTVFFLDEIHRFNKAQQDALLPAVEDGTVILIGATTENPYFEVNSALISRARIYELRALSDEDVITLLRRAEPATIRASVVLPVPGGP